MEVKIDALPENAFAQGNVYPFHGADGSGKPREKPADSKDYLATHFRSLKIFIDEAAAAGMGIMFVEC